MEKIIKTPCGEIQGTECGLPGVIAFKGIRYATAGRWEYPKMVTRWDDVYDATKYGNACYQQRTFNNESENPKKVFYYKEFREGVTYNYSEDCLFLNVWIPVNATPDSNLPVIFYIHGGGYKSGSADEKPFDDPIWPTKGVIAVTINYRLGPLGFLCLPELTEEAGHSGNYGLYDQLTALKWVHENISSFGGDPNRVTIMGQSAGAMSVQDLCLSPLSDGLFSGAVMSSGCGMGNFLKATPEKVYSFWETVMKRLGCENIDTLREIPVEKLLSEWQVARKEIKGGTFSHCPVKDGIFVVDNPIPKKISYIIGSNSHDMAPPFLFSLSKKWAIKNTENSYVYMLHRSMPGDKTGSWHSADLWYWFGTLKNCWRPFEAKDYEISDQMTTYLCNFAKNGNPNGENLPDWKTIKSSKKSMIFGNKPTKMGKPSMLRLTGIMLTTKSVGE